MAYVAPPVLPDFKRLQTFLTNSGVQKWNPDIYDILKRLIDANHQSQDVLVNTTIPDIINSSFISLNGFVANYLTLTISLTKAQVNSLQSSPITILEGIPNHTIVPVYSFTHFTQTGGAFSASVSPNYQYVTVGSPASIMPVGQVGSSLAAPIDNRTQIFLPTASTFTYTAGATHVGQGLRIRSSGDVTNTITTYTGVIQLTYILVPTTI